MKQSFCVAIIGATALSVTGIGVTGIGVATLLVPAVAEAQDEFPYELESGREIGLVAAGGATLGLALLLDHHTAVLDSAFITTLDRSQVNSFDRGATHRWSPTAAKASDYLSVTMVISPLLLTAGGGGAQEPWTVTAMYVETWLLNNGLTALIKTAVARTRPFVYNDDPQVPLQTKMSRTARRSFPSGHTSNAFASALFIGTVYDKLNPHSSAKGWVWGGALTLATTTGVLRYLAGKHYPTDILAGALLGAAVGYLVPKWHEKDLNDQTRLAEGKGFQVAWGFGF